MDVCRKLAQQRQLCKPPLNVQSIEEVAKIIERLLG